VLGLDSGADDYLVDPSPLPNCWRASACCCGGQDPDHLRRQLGDLALEVEDRRVYRSSKEILLTPRHSICSLFRAASRRLRRMLAKDVWRERIG
jgi:DNA-binding response OmpR family regulator